MIEAKGYETVLLTVKLGSKFEHCLSIQKVAQALDTDPGDLDPDFGVVAVDPEKHLYAIMVRSDKAGDLIEQNQNVMGPFSDSEIGAYGPAK